MRLRLNFLDHVGDDIANVNVAFTLQENLLVSHHERDLVAVRMFRQRAEARPELAQDGESVLLGLLESKVDHLADVLEGTHIRLEQLSRRVLGEKEVDLQSGLERLAKIEARNGQIRLDLMDTQRVLNSLHRRPWLEGGRDRLANVLRDVDSLLAHTAFLLEGITFLSNTVTGLITLEQNQIMKVLSIAAMVFLPPTLIASIYGMNFRHIPELSWFAGYPIALAIMVLAGVAPYWYAKRKGWI